MQYAAHQFRLSKPLNEKTDVTRRDHYKALAKKGLNVPELRPPEVSEHILYLLEWFQELSQSRQYGMSSPQPITYQELQSWAEMTGKKLHSFEVRILKQLDTIWFEIYHE